MFHSENNYCMESNYSSAICNYGLKLKSLCGLLMKLWPCLPLCESSNFRCRSRKHFSVAGSTCALLLPLLSPSAPGRPGWQEKGKVGTGKEKSLLSNKPAQVWNTVSILSAFCMLLLCIRDSLFPWCQGSGQEERAPSLKEPYLLLAYHLVYSISSHFLKASCCCTAISVDEITALL